MAKKKILFCNYSLHSGGIEKSLVTLLSLFDYTRYDVDLQLFANDGLFLPRVPEKVHLLPPLFPQVYKRNIREAPARLLLKQGQWKTAFCLRAGHARGPARHDGRAARARCGRPSAAPCAGNPNVYDAAVAYMEGQPIYYCVDFVKAKRKIGFIHGDYTGDGPLSGVRRAVFSETRRGLHGVRIVQGGVNREFPANARDNSTYNIICSRRRFCAGWRRKPRTSATTFPACACSQSRGFPSRRA